MQFTIISHRFYAVEISMFKIFKISKLFFFVKPYFKDFKPWDLNSVKVCEITLNYIANNCIWQTCVTFQGTNYELPEDDTVVSKHVGVW